MSDTGGDGVVGAGDVTVRPDARVYRMLLGKHGVDDYYDDSFELGLVGIGWAEWVEPAFVDGITDPALKQELKEAIATGKSGSFPVHAKTDPSTCVFPVDRPAVLQFDGLSMENATKFFHHWNNYPPYEALPTEISYAANQVSLFLTARPGDVIITRDPNGDYAYGVFSASATSLEPDDLRSREKGLPQRLKALSAGGHVYRPVSWAGAGKSESTVTSWLEAHGLGGASGIVKFDQRRTIFVATAGGGKGYTLEFLTSRAAHRFSPNQQSATTRTSETSSMHTLLHRAKTVILEGVPGTGKTWAIKHQICNTWTGQTLEGQGNGHYAITLHPATTYEDFVEGLRPTTAHVAVTSDQLPGPSTVSDAQSVRHHKKTIEGVDLVAHRYFHVRLPDIHESNTGDTGPSFAMQDGFFLRVCAEAANHPEHDYVVLLDEINRCNVPKVMGDLLTTLERSKRARWDGACWDLSPCQVVTLPGSKRLFFVPSNIYVVATMNSTDRSVAPLDAALRRRFAFHRCWPKGFEHGQKAADVVKVFRADVEHPERGGPLPTIAGESFCASVNSWATINAILLDDERGGPDALLGHSYLTDLADDLRAAGENVFEVESWVTHHWNHHVLPQLADALLTHNLGELVVSGKGKLLEVNVGGRAIQNRTLGTGRGQQTLILRLNAAVKSAPNSNGRNSENDGAQSRSWLTEQTVDKAIEFLKTAQDGTNKCGIYVHCHHGISHPWSAERTRVKNELFRQLETLRVPTGTDNVTFFKAGATDKMQAVPQPVEAPLGTPDGLAQCKRFVNDLKHEGYACFFNEQLEPQVRAIVKEMQHAALTP